MLTTRFSRLLKFDKKNWRASYNALILLEHLLTHGPKRIAEEFQSDHEDVIKQMGNFQYIDEKGFVICVTFFTKFSRLDFMKI